MTVHITPASSYGLMKQQDTFITVEQLKIALNIRLFGWASSGEQPLERLVLVERVLADPTFPPCDHARSIAVGLLLTTHITQELMRQRRALEIALPLNETCIQDALRAITSDAQAVSRELLGWSWLYYHFVRVELGIEASVFCRHAYVHERTLRRYEARALQHLTELLVIREWELRRLAVMTPPKGIEPVAV